MEEQRGTAFLNLSFWGKGESDKQEERLWGGRHKKNTQGIDHWTTLPEITYYFTFLWFKKIYALHKISSYSNLISKEV